MLPADKDMLPADKLDKAVKGVSTQILLSKPKECMVDATHAHINLASFLKLIVRCIILSIIFQWDALSSVKRKLMQK